MTKQYESTEFGTITESSLGDLSRAELTRLYNEITGEGRKPASTKTQCVDRVVGVLPEPEPQPKRAKKTKVETEPNPKKTTPARRSPFHLPATQEPKSVRAGSKRATTLGLLARKGGATVEEVMEAVGWDRRTAMDGIRLLHTYCGYGLEEGEDGRIRAVTA